MLRIEFGKLIVSRFDWLKLRSESGSRARLENMGDITAQWCGTVWETAEALLNFNSRDLRCIWRGGTRVERHLALVIYLCNFHSD